MDLMGLSYCLSLCRCSGWLARRAAAESNHCVVIMQSVMRC